MPTMGDSNEELRLRRDMISAKARKALADVLDRLEKSLLRLREVEAEASPATKRLLRKHIQMTEVRLTKASIDFLQSEPEPIMQQVYDMISERQQPQGHNDILR